MHKQRGNQTEEMVKRGGGAMHGAMNIMSSLLLCLTFGRLLVVLYGAGFAAQSTTSSSSSPAGSNPVPNWLPPPQQQPEDRHLTQQHDYQHRPATSQRTAYVAGRRGEAMPADLEQLSNHLRASGLGDLHAFGNSARSISRLDHRDSSRGVVGSSDGSSDASSATHAWGQGMRVLIFTMDSIQDAVAKSKKGGPAGEIIVRESLANTLTEAGVQVCVVFTDLFQDHLVLFWTLHIPEGRWTYVEH